MKRCPKCGATGRDEDVFCEADGARLEGTAASSSGSACPKCGAVGSDDGEGWCGGCGHRLAATNAPAIGARVGSFRIDRAHGDDDAIGKNDTGEEALVAVGEAIAREAAAIDALAAADDRRIPRIVERSASHLALSLPDGRPLVVVAPTLEAPAIARLLRDAAAIARKLDAANVSWVPRPVDFHVAADGALFLARLRVTPRAFVFDVRPVVDALATLLLPHATRLPNPVVRLLAKRPPGSIASIDVLDRALAEDEPPVVVEGAHVAGDTDLGVRHAHNEDAFAIASGSTRGDATHPARDWSILVVCDGVSSSSSAEQASSIAARTVVDAMSHFARSADLHHEAIAASLGEGIRAAHVAICAGTTDVVADNPPGCTVVAAFVYGSRVVVGWLGDSRAYWITSRAGEMLTKDHSWVNDAVDRGDMSEPDALASPYAHAITKCIGPLEDPKAQVDPSIRTRDLAGPGWLLLCSDGLWNYASSADAMATLVRSFPPDATPATIARALVRSALGRGGEDNVTAVVYRHDPPSTGARGPAPAPLPRSPR